MRFIIRYSWQNDAEPAGWRWLMREIEAADLAASQARADADIAKLPADVRQRVRVKVEESFLPVLAEIFGF